MHACVSYEEYRYILLNFTGMSEQMKSNTEQIGTIKAEHAKITSDISDIKKIIGQSEERLTQHAKESNSRINELESKVQDISAHTNQQQHQLEEMQETMAETRAEVANIQSQQGNSGSKTSKTSHKDGLGLYIEQHKFPGEVKYNTRARRGGYQSTVFVPRSGPFHGEVCRTKHQAEEDAACQALRTLGRI